MTKGTKLAERPAAEKLDQLLAQIAAGDKLALAEIYRLTSSAVYGFALSIVKNSYDAEDVLQNTFVRIFETAASYGSQGKPMAWIFTIVRNICLMELRGREKTTEFPEIWEDSHPRSKDIPREDRIVLKAALTGLLEEERQIVMLHNISGFKFREIAALLKLPLPTVLSKHHRAIKRLKARLEEE